MVMPSTTSFAIRPRRGLSVGMCILVMMTTLGCGHKRTSMRPVYVTPAPACTTPGCANDSEVTSPTTSVPGTSTMSGPSIPSIVEPSASTLGAPAAPAPSSAASPERIPSAVPGPAPSGGTRPGGLDEPTLIEPISPSSSGSTPGPNQPPSTGLSVPRLQVPRRLADRRGAPVKTTLREQLQPYTNDPDDLFSPPKADRPWKYIVLHHSASATGGYDSIDQEHRKRLGWQGCGYHFVIGNGTETPDGRIEVSQRWLNQKHGVHCRDAKTPDVSEYGIGICLVGDLETPPRPPARLPPRAPRRLPGGAPHISPDHIGTHARLASSPTACPGKHFPVAAVLGSTSSLVQR